MDYDITQDVAKELVAQTAEKTYDDLLHPALQTTGEVIGFIPRTIRVWLGKWEKWILNGEYSIKETEKLLAEKLEHIPEENIVEPEPYVAVPALQQLSYSFDSEELRNLYANLLASSMNCETKENVHPAFVDIIKQLIPDEAKLLRYFSTQYVIPAISVKRKSDDGKGYTHLEKIRVQIPKGVLETPQNLEVYIDNLVRLKLLEIPFDAHYVTETLYSALEKSVVYPDIPREKIEFERKIINITPFGKQFIRICQ